MVFEVEELFVEDIAKIAIDTRLESWILCRNDASPLVVRVQDKFSLAFQSLSKCQIECASDKQMRHN